MTSPQKLQRISQVLYSGVTQNHMNYASVLRTLLGPTFLILCYSPCPTVCPGTWGVFFISCFHVLRLSLYSAE